MKINAMKKLVHPCIMKRIERNKKLREELKYWKRKYRILEKKYEKDKKYAQEKLFRSRFKDFDYTL